MERAAAAEETTEEGMTMILTPTEGGGGEGGDGGGSLQFDAMAEILARLPVKSLARFRCVCKPWCSLTYDPHFIKKHHQIAASTTSSLFPYYGPLALYDVSSGKITKRTLPPPTEDLPPLPMLSNAVDGLVCGFRNLSVFLHNLSTGEVAPLPPTTEANKQCVGFGFDASTGAYKLLRVFSPAETPGDFLCQALTVSPNPEWRYLAPTTTPPSSISEFFYFNGFIHWICRKDAPLVVVAFNCKDETFSTIPIPESAARFQKAELVSFEGHLCFAGIHYCRLKIMMLEDYSCPEWKELYVIDCAFLVLQSTDLRIIGIKGGKVLLHKVRRKLVPGFTCRIYSYDLHSKVWSRMFYGKNKVTGFHLYEESLVSPKRLLSLHAE